MGLSEEIEALRYAQQRALEEVASRRKDKERDSEEARRHRLQSQGEALARKFIPLILKHREDLNRAGVFDLLGQVKQEWSRNPLQVHWNYYGGTRARITGLQEVVICGLSAKKGLEAGRKQYLAFSAEALSGKSDPANLAQSINSINNHKISNNQPAIVIEAADEIFLGAYVFEKEGFIPTYSTSSVSPDFFENMLPAKAYRAVGFIKGDTLEDRALLTIGAAMLSGHRQKHGIYGGITTGDWCLRDRYHPPIVLLELTPPISEFPSLPKHGYRGLVTTLDLENSGFKAETTAILASAMLHSQDTVTVDPPPDYTRGRFST